MTAIEKAKEIGEWIRQNPSEGSKLWDIIGALRGPDAGFGFDSSERADLTGEHSARYAARVSRKLQTVAVIRGAAIGQVGGARTRYQDHVVLPPQGQWDHFDKHIARAAVALKLKIETSKGRTA